MRKENHLVLLVAISLLTHLFMLDGKSVWVDEAYAAGLMHRTPGEVMRLSSVTTPHPPGSFLLMRASAAMAGGSPAGVRFLNAIVAASGVIPAFLLTRRFLDHAGAAFWAAMTWAVSPYSVSLGQEAWVYGLPASLSFWFLLLSTGQKEGRTCSSIPWFLTGLAGLYTQFSFVLAVLSGIWLRSITTGVSRRTLALASLLLLLWAPLVIRHAPALLERSERIQAAGVNAGTAPYRMLRNAPLAMAGLFTDGLVPGFYRAMPGDPAGAAAFIGGLALFLASLAALALDRGVPGRLRGWALVSTAVPFLMFLNDSPGERQLYLAAVPVTIGIGSLFMRSTTARLAAMVFLAASLGYWYALDTNAWHRSDWRGAAAYVTTASEPGDAVLVHSGQSGGVAWDISGGDPARVALGGDENPWSGVRGSTQPSGVAESILTRGTRLWLVADIWGDPPLPPGRTPAEIREFGRDMKVFLFIP